MRDLVFSYQNIIDGQGFSLAFAGMTIVFVALAAVSTFITLLPRILRVVDRYYPEKDGHAPAAARPEASADDEVMAVIAAALHAHRRGKR